MSNSVEYSLLSAVTPQAITSSTNASPIVVTKTSHGLTTGDKIVVIGHATNTAANGTWIVTVLTSSTFSLDGSTGNGVGGGTGIFYTAPKVVLAQDFSTIMLAMDTASSANLTVKVVGSISNAIPDFAEAQSATNQYDFIDMIDTEDGASIDGDTGFAPAGTDDNRQFEVNINGLRWVSVLITAWSAGSLSVNSRLFNPNRS